MVCFHAQQAAEKSIKAILALHDVVYSWKHDRAELLELAKPIARELEPFCHAIIGMTPYAVEGRYSRSFHSPEDEARERIEAAGRVHELARKRIEEAGGPPGG